MQRYEKTFPTKLLQKDFFGGNELAMEVHIGKSHSDVLECCICEYKAGDLEALETHIFTCEVFLCNHCKLKMKDLKNMKEHISEEHSGNSIFL